MQLLFFFEENMGGLENTVAENTLGQKKVFCYLIKSFI
jgi:hypothetical protein